MSSQQVLHQSKSFGAMRGSGSSGNGTSAPRAPLKRAARESCEDLLGCTQGKVHSSFHGPGTAANQTDDTFENQELIEERNPLLRGWVEYYKRAHIRKLFQRLDGWVRRRIWSHRYKCWRNADWKRLPAA